MSVAKALGQFLKELAKEMKRSIKNAKSRGVSRAWSQEKRMVGDGMDGTRPWSKREREELLARGRVKNYVGHHQNSVSGDATFEGKIARAETPENVKFMASKEHERLHRDNGGYRKVTEGELVERKNRGGSEDSGMIEHLVLVMSAGLGTAGAIIDMLDPFAVSDVACGELPENCAKYEQ